MRFIKYKFPQKSGRLFISYCCRATTQFNNYDMSLTQNSVMYKETKNTNAHINTANA